MGKRKLKPRSHTQKVVFNIPTTINKDLFLDFAMEIIGNRYVHLESKMDKIIFNIQGERNEIKEITERLTVISNQLDNAIKGKDGEYIYDLEFMNKLFQPHLKISYFSKSIELFGFEAKYEGKTLYTNANYFDLKNIHTKAVNAMQVMQSDHNRDIQKFFALIYLINGDEYQKIANIAIENNILKVINDKYSFAMDQEKAFTKMADLIDQPELLSLIEISEEEKISFENFFDGGKLVFIKNGEELDSSPFDIVDKRENIEE